jgi:hypothetical protein
LTTPSVDNTNQVHYNRFRENIIMKVFKSIISILTVSGLFVVSHAKKDEEDVVARALRDMQAGMAGLKEASNNPAMLAQLMRDLQVSVLIATCCMSDKLRVFQSPMLYLF